MAEIIYVCPNCSLESDEPGTCPECETELVATCSVCWNSIKECTCEEERQEEF